MTNNLLPHQSRRRLIRLSLQTLLLTAAMTGALTGCGFKLRGGQSFAFSSIAIVAPQHSPIALELGRSMGSSVQVTTGLPKSAPVQLVLQVTRDSTEKVVVGINTSGQVRELQLRNSFAFQLRTASGKELLSEQEIVQRRDISYSESAALAKEAEEALLVRDMRADIVQQVLRRLATLQVTQFD